ncbi:hypothetical protein [Pseudochryseolinea flava]|uniref:Protochlamydia outer membrane protein domain-containing protein n=1 Tax=Pseudochryseolinea flava TaxID=2059302 RepID=A0A364Y2G5_9BACT|nr:hypothetical protein [Pseudochryseolinea flava]RAW00872.1 hypothetical protein DQQ10_11560 [Pseudochryseolinea flava]
MKTPIHLLVTVSILLLMKLECYAQASTTTDRLSVKIATGFGDERLHWTIAGNSQGKNPNILSELHWKNVRGPLLDIGVSAKIKQRFLLKLSTKYQKTVSGTVTDTDYQGDDRTNQSFFFKANADNGFIFAFDAQIGYHFNISDRISLAPLVGFTRDQADLKLLDDESFGDQKLNSSYETIWKGMIVSLVTRFAISDRFEIAPIFSYRQLRYNAVADWNLIDEFQHPTSFKHYAKGFGIRSVLEVSYDISRNVCLLLQPQYEFSETGHGTDTVFFKNGQIENTRLNGVDRKSFSILIGTTINF